MEMENASIKKTGRLRKQVRRLAGILLILSGVFILLCLIGFIGLKIYLGSGMAANRIENILEAQTGGDFEIGNIRHHWPFTLVIQDLVGRPPGENTKPFAQVSEVRIVLGLNTLTAGILPSLIITDPRLTLEQNEDGNWRYLPQMKKEGGTTGPVIFPISDLQITNGDINLIVKGRQMRVAPVTVHIHAPRIQPFLEVSAEASIPETGSRLTSSGYIDVSSASPSYNMKARLELFPLIALDPIIHLFPQLGFSITDGVIDANLTALTSDEDLTVNGDANLRSLAGRYHDRDIGPISARMSIGSRIDRSLENASLDAFSLDIAGMGIIKASGTAPLKHAIPLALSVTVKDFDLAALGQALSLENIKSGTFAMALTQSKNPRGGGPISGTVQLKHFNGTLAGVGIHDANIEGRMLGHVADQAQGASATVEIGVRLGALDQPDRRINLTGQPMRLVTDVDYDVHDDRLTLASARLRAGSSLVVLTQGAIEHIASETPVYDLNIQLQPLSFTALQSELGRILPEWATLLSGMQKGRSEAEAHLTGPLNEPEFEGTLKIQDLAAGTNRVRIDSASAHIPLSYRQNRLLGTASISAATIALRSASGTPILTLLNTQARSDIIQSATGLHFAQIAVQTAETHAAQGNVSFLDTSAHGELVWNSTPSQILLNDMVFQFGTSGNLNVSADILPSVTTIRYFTVKGTDIPAQIVYRFILPFFPEAPSADEVEGQLGLWVSARDLTLASGTLSASMTATNFNLDTGDILIQGDGHAEFNIIPDRNKRHVSAKIQLEDGGFLYYDSSFFLDKHPLVLTAETRIDPRLSWPQDTSIQLQIQDWILAEASLNILSATRGGFPQSYQIELEVDNLASDASPTRTLADALQHFAPPLAGCLFGYESLGLRAAIAHDGRLLSGQMNAKGLSFVTSTNNLSLLGATFDLPLNLDLRGAPSVAEIQAPATGQISISSIRIGGIEIKDISTFKIQVERNQVKLPKPLIIPLFGGQLRISQFEAQRTDNGDAVLIGEVNAENMNIAEMTSGWSFGPVQGSMEAAFPRVAFEDGRFIMDGAVTARIFDGTAVLRDLTVTRCLDPILREYCFSFFADNINLIKPTTMTGFGTITGILRMDIPQACFVGSHWMPTALQADVRTVRHKGIQQTMDLTALNNLTKLASNTGIGATFFERFSYEGLGLSATVSEDRYQVRGLYRYDDYDLILKGSGIPRVNIILPNRERVRDFRTTYESLTNRINDIVMNNS